MQTQTSATTADDAIAPASMRDSWLERRFRLSAHGTNVRTELFAGLTTFITMAYIIFVNPAIMAIAGVDQGAAFVATCVGAALGCLLMGLYANWPVGLAPGMGLNAFFTDDGKGALRRFEEADRLHPNLPDVKRMVLEAKEKVRNPPPKPFPWFWVAIGVTLVSPGRFGGQWLHRWSKNRYRIHPSEVVRLAEGGKLPTILDARRSDQYEALPLKIPGSVRVAPEDLAASMAGLDLDTTRPVVAYCT